MFVLRRLLSCALLLSLAALPGCAILSSDAWKGPSPLSGPPPPDPVKQEKRETQGGFVVLVDAPGQPTAARAIADIGAFAQRRGFARQSAPSGVERYQSGKVTLDIWFRASDSRVVASLHSFRLSRSFVAGFYRDFHKEYAGQYGDEDPIIESDFGDDQDRAADAVNPGRGNGAGRRTR